MKLLCMALGFWCNFSGPALVVDGDTIQIGDQRIRIHGIDAPELRERGGLEAKQQLIRLIGPHEVDCRGTGKFSYDRVVAVCTAWGVELGAEMVRTGYALDCGRYSKGVYLKLEPPEARKRIKPKGYCS